MDVGIDALPLMGQGGISRHLRELFPAMLAAGLTHRYHLFARVFRRGRARHYREARQAFGGPRVTWHRLLLPDRLFELAWTRHDLVLPGTARCLRPLDVFMATAGLAPTGASCPVVGIVHDLIPLRFPQWFPTDGAATRARLERLVTRSRLLIAISERTRDDLRELLRVPADRIRVVHPGVHPRFAPAPASTVAAALAPHGIGERFFLHVGGLGPIKNVGMLLEAFRAFRDHPDAREALVLAGDTRWAGTLPDAVAALELREVVRVLGFVEDDRLPLLYAAATAVVVPSWYEGFGFPALEAMACGTPVLAARTGALPEVLGDAALFFAPDAPAELAGHLRRVATDEELRRALSRRGRERAARFTWERAAAATLSVLEEAATRRG